MHSLWFDKKFRSILAVSKSTSTSQPKIATNEQPTSIKRAATSYHQGVIPTGAAFQAKGGISGLICRTELRPVTNPQKPIGATIILDEERLRFLLEIAEGFGAAILALFVITLLWGPSGAITAFIPKLWHRWKGKALTTKH
jgi:hypothetical protein